MSYGMTHAVTKISATVFVFIRAVKAARVSFEYRAVIITTCSFSSIVLETGLKMSTATNSNRSVAGSK